MADDYTEAILYKWGLESLVESFREADINREALAALSGHADIIAVLIPSIGKRVIFLKKLHELHQESEPIVIMDNIPVVATTSFATENVVDCVIEDVSSISSASTIRVESPAARDTPPKPRLLAQKNAFYVKRKTKDVIPYPTTIPELTYNLQVAHSRGDLERNGHLHLELVRMLSVHLLGITNGNPTPTDYSNYSLAVVDKYPFLGDGSEHRNVSVRLRLQRCRTNHVYEEKRTLAGKSRKTKNLKIVHKSAVVSIHECTTKPAELVEDPMSDMMKELKKKGAGGGPHIKLLLVQTAQERRKVVAAATTCSDILDIFPHLSNTEMLIFDFGLIQDISNTSDAFAEVSRKLKVIFGKEDDHFEFADLENMNLFVRLLSRLHPRTKKGSRPLLELAMAGQEFDLTSEAVQGPCMVVYFDEKTIISSALLCEGRVMCHSGALSTHQLLLVLLGSYFVMDRNFPSAYVPASDEKSNDVIQSAMGLLGRWQVVICIWISLLKVPVAFYQLSIVLIAPPVDFRCRDAGATPDSQCSLPSGDKCQRYEYDRSVFTQTIITEWDLVCEREQLANVVQTTFMFGVLVGNVLFGMAADRFGRKMPLVLAVVIQLVTGVITAFCPWFELFLVVRFLSAMAVGGTMITSFVICMEIVGGKWRTIIAVLYHVPFSIGHSLLGVISYYFRDWHHFQLVISLPTVVLLAYWWTVPESPRWLLAVGKDKEAIALLETAAKKNKIGITDMKAHLGSVLNQNSKGGNEQRASIIDVFRTPNMRKKTLCIFFNWLVCGLCFFGLAQYMGHGAGGNIFVNVIISGLMELPGGVISIYCMNKFGRRNTLIGAQMFAAVACMLIMAVPPADESVQWLRVAFAGAGIVGMSVSFPTMYLFTGELFPTVVRNAGVGSSSMCTRLGSMLAPFIASLGSVSFYLPPLFFGLSPLVGSLLCFLLPETSGFELPETIEDGENFGKKKPKAVEGAANAGYASDEIAA